jgi:hypothetical protein
MTERATDPEFQAVIADKLETTKNIGGPYSRSCEAIGRLCAASTGTRTVTVVSPGEPRNEQKTAGFGLPGSALGRRIRVGYHRCHVLALQAVGPLLGPNGTPCLETSP